MTTADFQKVRELFLAARKLSGAAREIFLSESCADNAELRSEVASLLLNHDEPAPGAKMIDTPVLGTLGSRAMRSAIAEPIAPEVPDRIGQYRVIRPIGEGAMGCVYEAEQDNPRRRVALKVLRPGMFSQHIQQRFQRESQILARLHHPGIAQVFEAGTFGPTDRPSRIQPYFAMEFIEGDPLSKYATESKLDLRARLKLIARICDAVQHAHDRGIIHRDLKPANIMVINEGDGQDGSVQPKVLDFGVAHAADSDLKLTTIQTGMGQLIGTVAYMSPEQARGDPAQIDARSDVYALGVICYELLAGRLPYDVNNRMLHEAVRVIREEDPARLSSINRAFRGDVETIVAKSLEKDRDRRYPSAGAMATDIRRFLADEPIVARPATHTYHLRKFAQRNKALVGGLALTAAALLAGTVVSTGMYLKAEAARKGESKQAGIAKDKAIEAESANTVAQKEAKKARAVNAFIVERMLRSPDPSRDGRDIKVVEVLDKAAAEVGAAFPDDPETQAQVRHALAKTYQSLGQYEPMVPQAREVYQLRIGALGRTHPDTIEGAVLLGQALNNVANVEEAERVLRGALADLGDKATDSDPGALDLRGTLGDALQKANRFSEAEPLLRSVIAAREAISKEPSEDLMYNLNILGSCLDAAGNDEEALVYQQRFLGMAQRLFGPEHPSTLAAAINVANLMMATKRTAEAEPILKDVVAASDRVLGPAHAQTGMSRLSYAKCLARRAKNPEADEQFALAVSILRDALTDRSYTFETALGMHYEFLMLTGELRRAEILIRERLAARARRGGEHEEVQIEVWNNHITVMNRLSMCAESEVEARRAVALAQTLYPTGDARIARVESWLGETLICLKRYPEAEQLLIACYAAQENAPGLGGRDAWVTAGMLAQLYDRTGKRDQAQVWAKKSNN